MRKCITGDEPKSYEIVFKSLKFNADCTFYTQLTTSLVQTLVYRTSVVQLVKVMQHSFQIRLNY